MAHKKGLLEDLARLHIPVFQQQFKLHRSEAKNFSLGVSDVFVTHMTCVWCHLNFSNFRLFQAWVSFFSFLNKWQPFKNYQKCFYFIFLSTKVFSFSKYSNFCISFLPFFPFCQPVSNCSWRWRKINPKVYGVINWLNKNLKSHIVWYLEKGARPDNEP